MESEMHLKPTTIHPKTFFGKKRADKLLTPAHAGFGLVPPPKPIKKWATLGHKPNKRRISLAYVPN